VLTLTPTAAAVITNLLENADLSETSSVRIQRAGDPESEQAIGIAIVDHPGDDDEAVPAGFDNDVFLAPDLAELLGDHPRCGHKGRQSRFHLASPSRRRAAARPSKRGPSRHRRALELCSGTPQGTCPDL
jgi:hypothetical protein